MGATGNLAIRSAAVAFQATPLLLVALAWEIAARTKLLPSYIIPPLSSPLERLVAIMQEDFPIEIARSMGRLSFGLSCAVGIGLVLGIVMAQSKALRSLLEPVLRSLYPLPKTALIPVVILWFGLGNGA